MQAAGLAVLDGAQLRRQTMGDKALQVEVLALFVTEAERLMRQVEDAPDAQIRGDRIRALIALARNTGALRLAQVARSLETQIITEEPDLQPLRAAMTETIAYVQHAVA
jgi:HPt (histidine-containing phosphotransfer) domain-containing protein